MSKTHCSAQKGRKGCAGTCAGAARKAGLAGGRRLRSWTWRSGRTWPAWGGRAGLLGRAAHQRAVGAQPAYPQPSRHELTENMRSDPGIFNFVKWLRVGEEACPAGAGQGKAEGALLLQAIATQQAHGRERSGKPGPGAGGLKAAPIGDTSHPHRFGLPNNQSVYCAPKQPVEHEGVAGTYNHVRLDLSSATSRCATCTWAPQGPLAPRSSRAAGAVRLWRPGTCGCGQAVGRAL